MAVDLEATLSGTRDVTATNPTGTPYDPRWADAYRLDADTYAIYTAHGMAGLDAATSHHTLLKRLDVKDATEATAKLRTMTLGRTITDINRRLRDAVGSDAQRAALVLLDHADRND